MQLNAPSGSATDILIPEVRISGDKLAHHLDALRQIEIDHLHPWLRMNSGPPGKVRRSPTITFGIPNCTTAPLQR